MLNKYDQFYKISKNEECSIYSAVSRQTGQAVLLKRFKTDKLSWDEVLKSRNLQYTQKGKMFPKMIEIFRNKNDFYIVYDRPNGPSLANLETIAPLSIDNFYIIFNDLSEYLRELKSEVPGVYVLPDWIYLHRHTVKIVHFEPFFMTKDALSSDHVYLYKVENQIIPNEQEKLSQSSIVPMDKKRNIIFNLGMIAYRLLTGIKSANPQTQDQYLEMVQEISENAEKRILKTTKDKGLANLVGKMLSNNIFELPELEHIANFMSVKASEISPKKRSHTNNIQIQLQHLRLESSIPYEEPVRRKLRPCCAEKQASIEKINQQMRMNRSSKEHLRRGCLNSRVKEVRDSARNCGEQERRGFLPSIKRNGHQRVKTMMSLMNTTNSKPLMFNNRSLHF